MIKEHELLPRLEKVLMGKYVLLTKGLTELATRLDVTRLEAVAGIPLLESFHGIGMKTSRMIILHSFPGVRCAVLDTHILTFLRSKGHQAPYNTPSSRRTYLELEQNFLYLADKEGKTPADLDAELWRAASYRQPQVKHEPTVP